MAVAPAASFVVRLPTNTRAVEIRRSSLLNCPCGSGYTLAECCGPYLKRTKRPATAETLMRSRYSAYVLHDIDYIIETHAPETVNKVDRDSVEAWSKSVDWQGLEIVHTSDGGEYDDEGEVEFAAEYVLNGMLHTHHESSYFHKIGGVWFYYDGDVFAVEPITRVSRKVGRNDPCPCGSGKKHKKCCGAAVQNR